MVAISDKLGKASISNNYAIATTVKTVRAAGATVLEAYDVSKFPPDTPAYFVTYKKTTDPGTGLVSITNQVSYKALVNVGANTLTNLTVAPGYTDLGNAVGDFIELIPTSFWANSLIEALLSSHNPDGSIDLSKSEYPGVMKSYAGATAPAGYLLANGAAVSRTTYAALFAAIGEAWGAGDGTTTFNLPDGKGRNFVGLDAGQTEFNALGKVGGDKNMQQHNHSLNDPGHYHQQNVATTGGGGTGISGTANVQGNAGSTQDTSTRGTGISVNNAGSGTAGNLAPYFTGNWIIKT